MNEEKGKLVCGEEENICGTQKCTSQSTENGGKIKDEKAQDLNSSATTENGFSASVEKIERYLINECGVLILPKSLLHV